MDFRYLAIALLLWSFAAAASSDQGSGIDPNGNNAETGCMIDPNGCSATASALGGGGDEGNGLDPHG